MKVPALPVQHVTKTTVMESKTS
ncbi:hypothetical protein A2U01_0072357, partial [Trifolium medium]|nr:hypothetical protein [Trifolium medium]